MKEGKKEGRKEGRKGGKKEGREGREKRGGEKTKGREEQNAVIQMEEDCSEFPNEERDW